VAGSSGAVVGITWTMPVSTFAFGVAAATIFTPGIALISSRMPSRIFTGSSDSTMSTVTISGPLKPTPKSRLTSSAVTRSWEPGTARPDVGRAR